MAHVRITKAEWRTRGGLRNGDLFRKFNGAFWTYWKILDNR